MKISDTGSSVNLEAYARHIDEKENNRLSVNKQDKCPQKDDSVQLSSSAHKIFEAKKLIRAIPDVRAQKVADIKKQIEEGTYQLKPEKAASGLLRESLINHSMGS